MISKHDAFGCVNGSCDCAVMDKELTGEISFPALPKDIRLSKAGYVKQYRGVSPDELFQNVLYVVESLGTFEGYEIIGTRHFKGLTYIFSKPDSSVLPEMQEVFFDRDKYLDTPFEMEIIVNRVKSEDDSADNSELTLTYLYLAGSPMGGGAAYPRPPAANIARIICNVQTVKFIAKLDAYLTNTGSLFSNPKPVLQQEYLLQKKQRFRFDNRKRRIIILFPLVMGLILIVLRRIYG